MVVAPLDTGNEMGNVYQERSGQLTPLSLSCSLAITFVPVVVTTLVGHDVDVLNEVRLHHGSFQSLWTVVFEQATTQAREDPALVLLRLEGRAHDAHRERCPFESA
eukprot:GHVU01057944.1.p1 GENE.GHVU01057944.1~~GHVU01057944.1.p1  ORF type:complete len:106 (-),score=5.36 GHVU01057944.1:253-570(-)